MKTWTPINPNVSLVCGEDFPYLQIDKLNGVDGFFHMFTTRKGGISQGPYSSFNLSFSSGDSMESVSANLTLLSKFLGNYRNAMFAPKQVHGNNIILLDKALDNKDHNWRGDGVITRLKANPIYILTADCLPIILIDTQTECLGVLHAGWRSSFEDIASKAIALLQDKFKVNPRSVLVGFGPTIRGCCFQVGQELINLAREKFPDNYEQVISKKGTNHQSIDLVKFNQLRFLKTGLREENFFDSGLCTSCHKDLLFSHRAQGGVTGRQATVIVWR